MVATRPRATSSNPWRSTWFVLGACALVAFVALPMPEVQANHPQDGVTFDSLGGNEWWVDVQLGGNYAFYSPPEVRDSDGQWKAMDHPSWAGPGRYVASIHVEPGHLVKFRVTYRDTAVVSCWFTHPAGVETCNGGEEFSATFTPSGTSESIRLRIDSTQPVQNVYWRVTGTQNSWGGPYMTRTNAETGTVSTWASNVHVPEGEVLQFVASSYDEYSAIVESGCFRWPTITPTACPQMAALSVQPPISYDGDQRRMENQVYFYPGEGSSATLARMDVRFNGGPFNAMRLDREANGYSYHRFDQAPTNRAVAQYRSIDSTGAAMCGQIGYFWPPAGFPDRYNTGERIDFVNPSGSTTWVQTNLYSSKPVVAVEVQVNGGTWKAIQQQPYCDWAGAMDVPAGSTVRFRGFFPDLTSFTGDAMTWPPGSQPPPPPPPDAFDATFTGVRGNEWWEQASVSATGGTLAKVDVRLNGGAWQPLTKQSWGGWAASYRAVQGTTVQFRALSTTGAADLSDCYRWIPAANTDATKLTCPTAPPPPPPPSGFDATFTGVKGNEWWVQASVSANQPLSGVSARVNCSEEWRSLTKQSYGWSASFHVPTGSKVDFRAMSTTGNMDFSGGYTWPAATPTSAC